MNNDSNLFLIHFKDKIPSDSIFYLKESLEKANEEQKQKLFFAKIKNPLYGLLFSFLLPGLDRIYKGDIILGVIKMIFVIFAYLGYVISSYKRDITADIVTKFDNLATTQYSNSVAFFVFLIAVVAIWVIADYFLVWKGICKDNLKRIFEILQ